jgi:hypothetical protein
MLSPINPAFRFTPVVLVSLLVAGCATTDTTPTATAADGAKEEYVKLEPEIGSRVKRRVKKSELKKYVGTSPSQRAIITAETDTTMPPSQTTGEVERSNPAVMRPPGT